MTAAATDLIAACRILDGERLTDAFGHVSSLGGAGEILITPKLGPGRVNDPRQLLAMTPEGKLTSGDASLIPGEAALHRAIYRTRPDVRAVCRFHGAACMAWSTLGRPLPTTIGPALAFGVGVPVFETTRTVISDADADALAATLGSGAAVLLRGFGAVTVGRDVAEAVVLATMLERSAAAVLLASAAGTPRAYPPEAAEAMADPKNQPIVIGQIQRAWNYLRIRHAATPPVTAAPEEPKEQREMSTDTIWLELMGGGVQERYYRAGPIRTRVLEAGEGPALLLLHGTGGHAEAYCRNIVPLSARFRVLAVDLAGHGFSDRPEIAYTLDDFADHLEDLLDAAGIERAHISGESLGSAIAAWFAITRPERVDRLVLNTAVLALPTEKGLAELEDFARRTMAVMSDGFTRDAVRTRMEWLVSDPARMPEELVSCRWRIYQQPGMLATIGRVMMSVGGLFRGMSGQEYVEEGVMGRIQCPTLVLWTEHNPGQDADLARRVAGDIPDHEFRLMTDCGHWPQFERPDIFNHAHVEFLTSQRRAPAH